MQKLDWVQVKKNLESILNFYVGESLRAKRKEKLILHIDDENRTFIIKVEGKAN